MEGRTTGEKRGTGVAVAGAGAEARTGAEAPPRPAGGGQKSATEISAPDARPLFHPPPPRSPPPETRTRRWAAGTPEAAAAVAGLRWARAHSTAEEPPSTTERIAMSHDRCWPAARVPVVVPQVRTGARRTRALTRRRVRRRHRPHAAAAALGEVPPHRRGVPLRTRALGAARVASTTAAGITGTTENMGRRRSRGWMVAVAVRPGRRRDRTVPTMTRTHGLQRRQGQRQRVLLLLLLLHLLRTLLCHQAYA